MLAVALIYLFSLAINLKKRNVSTYSNYVTPGLRWTLSQFLEPKLWQFMQFSTVSLKMSVIFHLNMLVQGLAGCWHMCNMQ